MDRKEMKCTLFINKSDNANAPKLKALATINGVEYELAFWLAMVWEDNQKTDTPKLTASGDKYYTGTVKVKEEQQRAQTDTGPDF